MAMQHAGIADSAIMATAKYVSLMGHSESPINTFRRRLVLMIRVETDTVKKRFANADTEDHTNGAAWLVRNSSRCS
jgi:hypothetical protein